MSGYIIEPSSLVTVKYDEFRENGGNDSMFVEVVRNFQRDMTEYDYDTFYDDKGEIIIWKRKMFDIRVRDKVGIMEKMLNGVKLTKDEVMAWNVVPEVIEVHKLESVHWKHDHWQEIYAGYENSIHPHTKTSSEKFYKYESVNFSLSILDAAMFHYRNFGYDSLYFESGKWNGIFVPSEGKKTLYVEDEGIRNDQYARDKMAEKKDWLVPVLLSSSRISLPVDKNYRFYQPKWIFGDMPFIYCHVVQGAALNWFDSEVMRSQFYYLNQNVRKAKVAPTVMFDCPCYDCFSLYLNLKDQVVSQYQLSQISEEMRLVEVEEYIHTAEAEIVPILYSCVIKKGSSYEKSHLVSGASVQAEGSILLNSLSSALGEGDVFCVKCPCQDVSCVSLTVEGMPAYKSISLSDYWSMFGNVPIDFPCGYSVSCLKSDNVYSFSYDFVIKKNDELDIYVVNQSTGKSVLFYSYYLGDIDDSILLRRLYVILNRSYRYSIRGFKKKHQFIALLVSLLLRPVEPGGGDIDEGLPLNSDD
jgi:hypothetical protein